MSWFETGGLGVFAKTALSTAQKSIDRVLDIQDERGGTAGDTDEKSGKRPRSTETPATGQRAGSASGTAKPTRGTRSKTDLSPVPSATASKIPSDDSFFSAFLNDPSPSKRGGSRPKAGGPSSQARRTQPATRREPADSSPSPPLQPDEEEEEGAVRKQPGKAGKARKSAPEEVLQGNPPSDGIGTCDESASDIALDGPVAATTTSYASQQPLSPLEISVTDAGSLTGSTSSFVPISKEDVEDYHPLQASPRSADELMSVSQTELRGRATPEELGPGGGNGDGESLETEEAAVKDTDEMDLGSKTREGSPSDAKSEHSVETNADSQATTCSSGSDFVVIPELAGSERSSLSNYDARGSPEAQSPKHFSSAASTGKRSPDSDFSIISEGRFHGFHEAADAPRPQSPALLDETGTDFHSRRGSAAYSADVESEDQDEREPSASTASFKAAAAEGGFGAGDELREGCLTPTQEGRGEVISSEPSRRGEAFDMDAAAVPCTEKGRDGAGMSDASTAGVDIAGGNGADTSQGPLQTENLLKKLADMALVLQAREDQVLSLSNKNADLHESVSILKSQLQQSEETREMEMTDLTQLTEEFTQRISSMERKLQASQKERDALKRDAQRLTSELAKRDTSNQTAAVLQEKDETIRDLMGEGEKLSKQQLQNSTVIKKLRAKEKENETLITTQKQQLDEATERVAHLEKVLDGKEEVERQQKDIVKRLNAAVERQEKEISSQRSDLEDSKEKTRSTQAALDASYKDLAELHRSIATKDSEAHESKLSTEMSAKEELRLALERNQLETRREQEGLLLQISDLQMGLTRQEKHQAHKEGHLRQEIADLQMRLQEAEARNQELSQSVSAATRPLLRQIENLNTTFNAQAGNWERVERQLTERLADSQASLAAASERERAASEGALVAGSKLSSLESQLALLRQDKSRLQAGAEMERARAESLEESKAREVAQTEAQLGTYAKALEEAQREKTHLEKQLEVERLRTETERRKLTLAQEALCEKERKPSAHPEDGSSSSHGNRSGASTPVQNLPSTPGPFHTPTQVDILERTMSWSTSASLYDSVSGGSATSVIEGLQAQLKQREGEIAQLQGEVIQLERTRAAMAEEIVKQSNLNETLDGHAKLLPEYKRKLMETETRYNAVLQMYGEKAEEVQELKMDLQDVKEMYRQQIEDLIHS